MKIVITGCSGLVGSALMEYLVNKGNTIHCLTRNKNSDGLIWNPQKIDELNEKHGPIDAVVHLAGENISTGRWTKSKKKRIYRSRVQGTNEIASYFSSLDTPPKVMVFASAVGYYGETGNQKINEKSPLGKGFLADVCDNWERAALPASEAGVRVAYARFGMVLSSKGGALQKMIPPFRAGLGGKVGSGNQYISWISIRDLVAGIDFLLNNDQLEGVFNFTSENPVTNMELTKQLGRVLHKHTVLPLPGFMVSLLLGQMGKDLLLSSCRAYPERLIENGFVFRYSTIKDALTHCVEPE